MAEQKAALPGGQVVIDDCKDDGLYHGRHRPAGDATGEWKPVTEEAPIDNQVWARQNAVWVVAAAGGVYHFATGLSFDDVSRDVNLLPAGDSPATLGGVYIIDRERNVEEGLELGIDGRLRAPLATPRLAGTIVEPEDDGKGYVRTTLNGVSMWVPPAGGGAQYHFVLGLTHDDASGDVNVTPAGTTPELLGGVYVPTRDATQAADVDTSGGDGKLVVLTATDTLLGGMLEPVKDGLPYERQWNETAQKWEWVQPAASADTHYVLGLTHDDATGDVNLTPAGWAPEFLGGVYTNGGRSATEGLDLAAAGTGQISAPLATPDLAGTIVEPPADDKGYVRRTLANGQSSWVPPADTQMPFAGLGLSMDETSTPFTINLQPAGYGDPKFLGGIYEPPMDGMAYSRQYEVATNSWLWTPALTAGLQITSIIPDKAIFGPTEPLLDVHAYGMEFTATCVIHVDGNPAQTTYVSPTELIFVLNPAVPINEQTHIITVHETAPTPVDGLGAEQFDFIVASIAVDYGTGLAFDTATDPPIVNLQPAQDAPNAIGGVYVIDRERNQWEGLELGIDGRLRVPEATDALLGGILEPPPDDKGYVRRRTVAGESAWVPPADSGIIVQDEPPVSPPPNSLWWDSNAGKLYLWYDDGTTVQWVQVDGGAPSDPYHFVLGLTHDEATGDVNLTPAGWDQSFLGGVWTATGRSATEGLDLAATGTGQLSVPLATDLLAGSIVEPPPDGQKYVRERLSTGVSQWVHAAAHMDYGIGLYEWFDQAGERLNRVDLKPATPNEIGGIKEPPLSPTGVTYGRINNEWVPLPPSATTIEAGIGLEKTGDIIDLQPPKPSPQPELGGVYGTPRSDRNAVVIDSNGHINVPVATDLLLGGILEPPPDDKQYARKRTLVGNSSWVEVSDSTGGINDVPREPVAEEYVRSYGRWLPVQKGGQVQPRKVNVGGDTMTGLLILSGDPVDELGAVPRRMLNDLKQYVDAQDTADRLWVETYYLDKAPPGGPYWMLDGAWSNIPAMAAVVDYGIGLTLDSTTTPNATVNLNVANFNGEIGGVKVVGRSPIQGLEYDLTTGTLWAPLATNLLAGVLTEPPADQKGYVRASQADGSWQWVPPADGGGGLTISDTPPVDPAHGDMWWESDSGDLFVFYVDPSGPPGQWVEAVAGAEPGTKMWVRDTAPTTADGIRAGDLWFDSDSGSLAIYYQDVDSSQWVQLNGSQGSGDFLPLTGGTVTGPITLPVADPTLPEHATHKKYVDVAIANQALYQSTWQVAANVPDLTVATANPLHGYSWTAVTVNPAVPEVALASLPGIGGTSIASGDTIKYNATLLIYEHIKTASSAGGIGDAPSDGEEYVRKDATWVIGSGVLKTGDLMTGALEVQSAPANGKLSLMPGDATNNGRVEWHNPDGTRKAYIGYRDPTTLEVNLDSATRLNITGGSVFATQTTANANGYFLGDVWHGMYFNGSNTLIFTEYHNRFEWRTQTSGVQPGGSLAMSLYGNNLVVTGNINANGGLGIAGNTTHTGVTHCNGMLNINAGAVLSETLGMQIGQTVDRMIGGGNGNGGIVYRSSDRHKMFVGPSQFMEIDSGGVEMWGTVTDSRSLAEDLPGSQTVDGGFNVIATLKLMAAKIKQLETELATYKARLDVCCPE